MNENNEALRLAELLDDSSLTVHHKSAAELRRLHGVEQAYVTWQEKTEWVQHNIQGKELGHHRADVLRQRIECLYAENESLRADAERYRWWRDNACREPGLVATLLGPLVYPHEIDAAIDAARSKT